MSKNKFGGIILSVNHFDKPGQSGGCGVLIKVLTKNGEVFEPTLVDIKREDPAFIKLLQEKQGLETSAQVTFEATGILDHQEGVDRVLPAKDNYPAQPVHQLRGYTKGSLAITRWVKEKALVLETDETKITMAKRLSFATMMDKAVNAVKGVISGK